MQCGFTYRNSCLVAPASHFDCTLCAGGEIGSSYWSTSCTLITCRMCFHPCWILVVSVLQVHLPSRHRRLIFVVLHYNENIRPAERKLSAPIAPSFWNRCVIYVETSQLEIGNLALRKWGHAFPGLDEWTSEWQTLMSGGLDGLYEVVPERVIRTKTIL